jgi:hypothetical protein
MQLTRSFVLLFGISTKALPSGDFEDDGKTIFRSALQDRGGLS